MRPSPAPVGLSTPAPAPAPPDTASASHTDVPSPSPARETNVTALLRAWGAGDRAALDALIPVVYAELRRQARRALRREAAGSTLGTTAVVHEAYLRFVDQDAIAWRDRAQFFGIAANLMRQVLVDHARTRHAAKRGGGAVAVPLDEADALAPERGDEVLALDEALARLAALDPDQARVVELRYFGGLTIAETAAVLGVSPTTVKREWAVASAWLRREIAS